eukprot:14345452-Ditylum_brightwellii.AAC.1
MSDQIVESVPSMASFFRESMLVRWMGSSLVRGETLGEVVVVVLPLPSQQLRADQGQLQCHCQ